MMSWKSAFLFFNSGYGTQNIFKQNSSVNPPAAALGIDFQSAEYGPPITIVYGQNKTTGNVISYDDFASTPATSPGKGGGGVPTGYTYTASFLLALCEGTIASIASVYDGTTQYMPGNGPLDGNFFADGSTGQAAWSHLSGAAALGYSKTALYGFVNYQLGGSASLPNLNFEIAGLKQYGGGIVDANPADILSDICTDPDHGINFNLLGDLTQYSDYCVANGIFMSPIFDQKSTAQQALTDLLTYTNTEAFFSEGELKVIPRGDTSVTGNGVTFTPVTTIQYQLTYDDFITSNKGDVPVTVERKAPSACRNIVQLSFNDRAYSYHPSTVIASIDYDVLVNGQRVDDDETYAGITTGAVAKIVAQNLLQLDFYVRNTYKFNLPWRFCRLEPMDLLELTDPNIGLNNTPVRVVSVEEDEAGLLAIVAEEYPEGVGYAVMFPAEPNVGTNQDMTVDPGPVQAPYIVRGPGLLVSNNEPEIWIAVTGTDPAWGGCTAYLSYDGVSYHPVNQIARQALYGILELPVWAAANVQTVGQLIQDSGGNTQRVAAITGDFKTGGSHPTWGATVGATTTDNHVTWVCVALGLVSLPISGDPDQVNITRAYLYRGTLAGGSQTDADNFATLSMVDTELVAYETATLASDGGYDLGYVRRGGYNSAIAAHASGCPFMRMDGNIIRVPVDPSQVGATVYLKFLSVNVFNRTPRTLADETAYSYVVGSNLETPDVPTTVSSLTVKAAADTVSITWTNPSDIAVGATSIEYTPTWEPFNPYTVGQIIVDQNGNTQQVSAITTGISGNYPVPTFAAILGNTTTDAGITWTCIYIGPTTQTNLGTPATPMISVLPGAGPSGTYFFKITYLDQYGLESLPSAEVTAIITSAQNVQLSLNGVPPAGAVAWRIYANTTTGTEKQMTAYLSLPITQASQITTSTSINSTAPPTFDETAQGGFTVLHTTEGATNNYKHTQNGDQEYYYRIRQRGWLAQAGWGPYSAIVSAKNANAVRKNSKLGSANMLLDPNLLRTRASGDFTFWTYDNVDYTVNMTGSEDGTQAFQITNGGSSSNVVMANEFIPVNRRAIMYARLRAVAGTSSAGNLLFGVAWYDQTFTQISTSEASIPVGNLTAGWLNYGQYFNVPNTAYYARFYTRGGGTMVGNVLANNFFLSAMDYQLGSTPTTLCSTTLSYSSTTTSVSVSWSSFTLRLPDGTTISVPNGSQNNTGLSSSHTYYVYPSYDIAKQGSNGGVTFQTGGTGTPGTCYSAVSTVACNAQNNLNEIPMSTGAFQVATPSSGTGSGSGGGSSGGTGGCLHEADLLDVEGEPGVKAKKPAGLLRDGDKVWTPRGWRPVSGVRHEDDSDFIEVGLSNGQKVTRSAQHRVIDAGDREVMVSDLKLGQLLKAECGRVRVESLILMSPTAKRVSFSVQRQIFYAQVGGLTEHNANGKP